jgi:hypothetical protein
MTSVKRFALPLTLVIAFALTSGLAAQSTPQKRHVKNYQVFLFPTHSEEQQAPPTRSTTSVG